MPIGYGPVLRVGRLLREHQRPPVAPSLAHAAALHGVERVGVGRPAGQAVGHAVAVFVDDDPVVEIAVAVAEWCG